MDFFMVMNISSFAVWGLTFVSFVTFVVNIFL